MVEIMNRDYKNAILYFEKCISLNSKNPNTYFSLAFTHHINNQLYKAITYYHKVRRDILITGNVNNALLI